jgi:predicted LPLAT superfamily acyltransferase
MREGEPEAPVRPVWAERAERGSALALRFMLSVIRRLGRPVARLILIPIAAYFLLSDAASRRASRAYFARLYAIPEGRAALGHPPDLRDVYRHLFEFAIAILDRVCVWAGFDDDFAFEHRGAGHFAHLPEGRGGNRNALGKRGAMIVGAHIGSFDMMRSICMAADVPVSVVMYGDNAQTINRFLDALNPKLNLRMIHVRSDASGSSLEIRAAIERGEFVAIMGDRVPVTGRGTRKLEFLGAPARFSEGPFQLAALIGCPVIVACALRTGDRSYRVESEPLYAGGRVPRAQRDAVVGEMLEGFVRHLERTCVRAPYQWFNWFDFWADASVGATEHPSRS